MRELAVRDPLNMFLKEIETYPLLTREEEHKLAVKYHQEKDFESAKKLVVSNLRFVVKIASEYISYGFPLPDLIQEGTIGLMQAVKKFNPYKGYRLISYAVWWIRAKIHNFIMKSWSIVKIGTTQAERKLFQKVSRGKKQLNIVDAELTDENLKKVADLFGVRDEDVLSMEMRVSSRDFSLDNVSTDDDTITYLDSISDYRANQEEIIESVQTSELTQEGLQKGLEKLSPRERHVIERRYITSSPMKLRELGDEMDISKERVRQIETQAL
ncbi:MAG: RNA polymerase factor sigma-32, partial [Deltaproteobacteria bacterium]|nr:RNA polymerase factor sigma-32 [Deltaproteobacteria bacterium]